MPAWIREGLEKMEREKQKKFEKEQKKKAEEEAKLAKEQAEKEAEEEAERQNNGEARVPRKSRFVSELRAFFSSGVLSADDLCKQFGSKSGPAEHSDSVP